MIANPTVSARRTRHRPGHRRGRVLRATNALFAPLLALAFAWLPGTALAQNLKDVSPTTLTINEGSSADVTFSLASQPSTESYSIDVFPRSPGLISFNVTTFNFSSSNWNDTRTLTVTASQDADALSGVVRFSINPQSGTAVDVYVTVLDDETSSGPAVTTASSGYFGNEGATTPLTGPIKGGTDIYTKVVFNEPVTHTAGDGASARPDIRHKIGTGAGTGTQFDIVAKTGTLGNGDCWPQDSEGNNTSGDTPSTTYVCRYETANSDSGGFGFVVGTSVFEPQAASRPSSAYRVRHQDQHRQHRAHRVERRLLQRRRHLHLAQRHGEKGRRTSTPR